MFKKLFSLMAALLFVAGAMPVGAQVVPGPVVEPHGFPHYYTDNGGEGLSLELCLDNTVMCFIDPVEEGNAFSELVGFGPEAFWFLAEAEMRNLPAPPGRSEGRALLVLGLEAAYGGDEAIQDGNQIAFGRVRIRIDTAQAGDYLVTHPYGQVEFLNVPIGRRAINYTQDIGGVNPGNPAAAFSGAGASPITQFLTWEDYQTDNRLLVDGKRYIGHPDIANIVTGSPNETNYFRIEYRPNAQTAYTLYNNNAHQPLFSVYGRVLSDDEVTPKTEYANVPEQRLLAVGPVNRDVAFSQEEFGVATAGDITSELFAGYPKGFPLWYEENLGDNANPVPGLQLTICPGGNPMCISDPIDPLNQGSRDLNVGGEAFWWSAFAVINQDADGVTGTVPNNFDASLDLAIEGAFGGDEAIEDGNQISFGRVRIRIDVPAAGTYTVTHPYGQVVFTGVTLADGINYTQDIGGVNPFDPDAAFDGALYSGIGPQFLKWETFDPDPLLTDERLIKEETFLDENGLDVVREVYYVGDPAILSPVVGGSNGNIFRVQGPNIDVSTNLFAISGKVFTQDTFEAVVPPTTVPVANADSATTIGTAPVPINVLANDTIGGVLVADSGFNVSVAINQPANGTAVLGDGNLVTYTANGGFVGTDSFTYTLTNNSVEPAVTSDPGTVTITVLPVEQVDVTRGRLETRRMRWDIRGTGNVTAEGQTLTLRMGSATGTIIGTATVSNGRWSLRTTTPLAVPPAGTVQIYVVSDSRPDGHGPFTVQVR